MKLGENLMLTRGFSNILSISFAKGLFCVRSVVNFLLNREEKVINQLIQSNATPLNFQVQRITRLINKFSITCSAHNFIPTHRYIQYGVIPKKLCMFLSSHISNNTALVFC